MIGANCNPGSHRGLTIGCSVADVEDPRRVGDLQSVHRDKKHRRIWLCCPNIMRGHDDLEEPIDVDKRRGASWTSLSVIITAVFVASAKSNRRSERNEVSFCQAVDAELWNESVDRCVDGEFSTTIVPPMSTRIASRRASITVSVPLSASGHSALRDRRAEIGPWAVPTAEGWLTPILLRIPAFC